jgi:hypothetical protein
MHIYYDMFEDLDPEEYALWVCETCGTAPNDYAAMNTETRLIWVHTSGCYGATDRTYTYRDFLDKFWENPYEWPEEPFNLLINDVKEMNEK